MQELDNEFRLANVPVEKRKDPEIIKRVLGESIADLGGARISYLAFLEQYGTVLNIGDLAQRDEPFENWSHFNTPERLRPAPDSGMRSPASISETV